MRPSDYFDRNIKIGSSNTRRREIGRRYEIGVDNIMWGNDFPHPEGTWPYTREFLKNRFWDVPARRDREDARPQPRRLLRLRRRTASARSPSASARLPTTSARPTPRQFAKWDELREVGRPWLTGKEVAGAGMH